jgi:HNH endonuclease
MPVEARGVYIDLLSFAWTEAGLPADLDGLHTYVGLGKQKFKRPWEAHLSSKWESDGNGRLVPVVPLRRSPWFPSDHVRPSRYIPAYVKRAVVARDGDVCQICGALLTTGETPDLDHIVPLSEGGPSTVGNLRVTHASCNRSRPRR